MANVMTIAQWSESEIRFIQANHQSKAPVMIFARAEPWPSGNMEVAEGIISQAVAVMPIRPKQIVAVVPRRHILMRQMRLPSQDPDEIADMIGLQLVNKIPYPVEDMIYGHRILGREQAGHTRALVTLIHQGTSRRYSLPFLRAGIPEVRLTCSSFGAAAWLNYHETLYGLEPGHPVAVLNLDAGSGELCFCAGGQLYFSRALTESGFSSKEILSEVFVEEVKQTLAAYHQQELGPPVQAFVVIVPEGVGRDGLKERLEAVLKIPVVMANAWGAMAFHASLRSHMAEVSRSHTLAACLGLLAGLSPDIINLAPPEIAFRQKVREERNQWTAFACFVLVAALLIITGQLGDVQRKQSRLETLKASMTEMQPQVQAAAENIRFVRALDHDLSRTAFIPDLISSLADLAPEEIFFRTLSFDQKGRLTVLGYAGHNGDVNLFQSRLIGSGRYKNIDLIFATKRTIGHKPVIDFKIAFQWDAEGRDFDGRDDER